MGNFSRNDLWAKLSGATTTSIEETQDISIDTTSKQQEDQIPNTENPSTTKPTVVSPLSQYYLRDIAQLEKHAMQQKLILGKLILQGQATVIYAKQNTGKTLLALYLILDGIKAANFDPEKLIYINMDDDINGLAEKARLAQEFKFQMVADGYNGFESRIFRAAMERMINTEAAQGFIIVLDTLKKFVNTMDKDKSADFAKVVRQFVLKGGTVIALSHANKNPGKDGKVVYSGTTDIIDDFDCGYTLSTISENSEKNLKVVEFENIKKRGNVALTVAYSYATEPDIPYYELLSSVQEVDPNQIASTKHENEVKTDEEVIAAVESCITRGVSTKMLLAELTSRQTSISKRQALKVIDRYTGNDPSIHRWSFVVKDRGAKVFELLSRPEAQSPDPGMTAP